MRLAVRLRLRRLYDVERGLDPEAAQRRLDEATGGRRREGDSFHARARRRDRGDRSPEGDSLARDELGDAADEAVLDLRRSRGGEAPLPVPVRDDVVDAKPLRPRAVRFGDVDSER